jgi:lipid-binding SYLF domain-containing protein
MPFLRSGCATAALAALLVAAASPLLAQDAAAPASADAKSAERTARLEMAQSALNKLYHAQPDAREAVEKGAGYAVFDVDSVYAVLFVGQKGKGVLIDNASSKPVFMQSTRVGTGPGVGKQRVYQVFVFKSKSAMDQFVAAGDTGADVGASLSTGTDGVVRSFNPSIDIYQIPTSGMAVQASWGGTVYTVDKELQ